MVAPFWNPLPLIVRGVLPPVDPAAGETLATETGAGCTTAAERDEGPAGELALQPAVMPATPAIRVNERKRLDMTVSSFPATGRRRDDRVVEKMGLHT
jgi:hypothetical protein